MCVCPSVSLAGDLLVASSLTSTNMRITTSVSSGPYFLLSAWVHVCVCVQVCVCECVCVCPYK